MCRFCRCQALAEGAGIRGIRVTESKALPEVIELTQTNLLR